ncbi:hypothetical protein [Nereida ignava]|uniref:hypothetical protein n=1 Tax=Nereida ignava TaxID=282199 RepID=UPI0018F60ED4|nr:hypothetical protein [Nereida ignava]
MKREAGAGSLRLRQVSVRFICGTQEEHKQLEAQISAFLGFEDTILYGSYFEHRSALRPARRRAEIICTSSTPLSATRITGAMSLIRTMSDCGKSSSVCWVGMPSSSSCIMRVYSTHFTCCS